MFQVPFSTDDGYLLWSCSPPAAEYALTITVQFFSITIKRLTVKTLLGVDQDFNTAQDFRDFLNQGQRLNPPSYCPLEVIEIMQKCWRLQPQERPRFGLIADEMSQLVCTDYRRWDGKIFYACGIFHWILVSSSTSHFIAKDCTSVKVNIFQKIVGNTRESWKDGTKGTFPYKTACTSWWPERQM